MRQILNNLVFVVSLALGFFVGCSAQGGNDSNVSENAITEGGRPSPSTPSDNLEPSAQWLVKGGPHRVSAYRPSRDRDYDIQTDTPVESLGACVEERCLIWQTGLRHKGSIGYIAREHLTTSIWVQNDNAELFSSDPTLEPSETDRTLARGTALTYLGVTKSRDYYVHVSDEAGVEGWVFHEDVSTIAPTP